jgi:hypothetical protein
MRQARRPTAYEGVYATAPPCNGKELLSSAGLSPLSYWELLLGRYLVFTSGMDRLRRFALTRHDVAHGRSIPSAGMTFPFQVLS